MLPRSLYAYIWRTSRRWQIQIILLIGVISPLAMAPLELQRRIVDHAVGGHALWLLAVLGLAYLGVVLAQGGLKYVLNIAKGRVLEEITRDLRRRIIRRVHHEADEPPVDRGAAVSMLAAESEDVGGFASQSLSVPLLQLGTIFWVLGYLVWVEPQIAVLALFVYAPQFILVPRIQAGINRLSRQRTALVRRLGHDAALDETADAAERSRGQGHAGLLIQQIFRTRMLIYRRKFFLTFLGNFLDALGPIIVLMVGGYLVIEGRTEVSTLVVFISGFQRISDPWDQLVTFYRTISIARVAYAMIDEALGGRLPDPVPGEQGLPALG
jgi:ABC-type multidrug transport system fused ATPase/permease subunit